MKDTKQNEMNFNEVICDLLEYAAMLEELCCDEADNCDCGVSDECLKCPHYNKPFDGHEPMNHVVDRIVYNGPATIVFFNDGTKSVAKCDESDTYDRVMGTLIAFAKRFLGSDEVIRILEGDYAKEMYMAIALTFISTDSLTKMLEFANSAEDAASNRKDSKK